MNRNALPSKLRPALEVWSFYAWMIVFIYCVYQYFNNTDFVPYLYVGIVSSLFMFITGKAFITNLYVRSRLLGRPFKFIPSLYLIKKNKEKKGCLWLGWGFDWNNGHTQDAYEIDNKIEEEWRPNWFVIKFFSLFGRVSKPYSNNKAEKPKGFKWIHGIEEEKDIFIPTNDLEGHTLVVGTTGAGKTRLYESLITSAIHRGECVIVLDPKGDQELRERMQLECDRADRPTDFAYFHPSHPKSSVKIDPLLNWNRSSEIASRITALMGNSKEAGFKSFSWQAVDNIVSALIKIGKRPTISRIKYYVQSGTEELLIEALEKQFDIEGFDWKKEIAEYERRAKKGEFVRKNKDASDEAVARVEYYREMFNESSRSEDINSLISTWDHAKDHFGKMVATLIPVLSKLDSEDLRPLISPETSDGNDPRPLLNSAGIINKKMCLYMGLGSLSSKDIAGAIGSIFLADLTAVASDIYDFQNKDNVKISLFVDEAAEVVSPEFLQLCNKARGAGFKITFATQTIADFEAKLGSASEASQLIANANNVIALRVKDEKTLKFVSEKFGVNNVKELVVNQNTNSVSSDKDITNFTGGYGERIQEKEVPTVSVDMLANLPDLEYFASLSAGRVVKGRLPLFESEEMPSYNDQFWLRRDL